MENIQPHDWFFKQIFSNPKSVKTVLDIFAPDLAEEVVGGDEKMITLTEKWKIEGKMEGKLEAKMEDLIKLTQLKFGVIPESLEKIIRQCKEIEELDKIFTKVALAKSIKELENIK